MDPATLPAILMTALALAVVVMLIRSLTKALPSALQPAFRKQALLVAALWFLLHGLLAARGFYTINGLPPRPVVAMIFGVILLAAWSFSEKGRMALSAMPLHTLLYLQGFRIVVELLLWTGYKRGFLPVQMTFEGHNWDIVAGVGGLLAGALVQRGGRAARGIALAYNIIGLLLLINVLQVALRSMPTSLRTYTEGPDLGIVGTFPFIYLPVVLVVVAIAAHIFSLRQLALKRSGTHTNGDHSGVVA